jgi:YccS/YhfK family integral membrane protein
MARIQDQFRELRYFLYSQAFADGLRTTMAILLPSMAGYYEGHFEVGMTLSLGALCVSLTDAPGPIINKRNGMLLCILALFIISLITALARLHTVTMGIELVAVAFFFSMFNAYGARAAGVGNAAILIMILTMDKVIPASGALLHSNLIAAGGLWYFSISYIFSMVSPYRPAQRVLGECLREMARYLQIKADFYDPATDLAADYRRLVARQILVNEKQDAAREILFKTRQIVTETTHTGRRMVLLFVEAVDLFEDITASYYDYAQLRDRFAATGILEEIAAEIRLIAGELDRMGIAVQMNRPYRPLADIDARLALVKTRVDNLPRLGSESHLVLKKILVNLRRLAQRHGELQRYFGDSVPERRNPLDHGRFVSHQPLDPHIFSENLTLDSGVFRHALRVCLACLAGYGMTRMIAYGQHSYWVLLTIAFILKPAFSLTRERNVQRIIGTVAGGVIGITVLLLVPLRKAQFAIMVLFMLLTYSFMRINYLLMVLFTTPFVLLLFTFLGMPFREVALERIFDTVLGCAIAFGASVFLFPAWEARQLNMHLAGLLRADHTYLSLLIDALEGRPVSLLSYKLARKDIYVQTANVSSLFQRMLNEPRNLQSGPSQLQELVVLQHILFSNLATISGELMRKPTQVYDPTLQHLARKARSSLTQSLEQIGEPDDPPAPEGSEAPAATGAAAPDPLLQSQLEFILQVSQEMRQVLRFTAKKSAN